MQRGKVVESQGKRSGKVAFLSDSEEIVEKMKRISAEVTSLSVDFAEIPQVILFLL